MTHRLAAVAAACLVSVATAFEPERQTPAGGPPAQAPTFRAGVDLIPVDVQVVDSSGQPVKGLTAAQFDVTVNGKKRRVVSADLIDYRPASASASDTGPSASPAAPPATSPSRRILILAVDCLSLDQATAVPVLASAAAFVEKLQPDLEVGLFAYPIGPKLNPTTDHATIVRAIRTIMAQRDAPPPGDFNLSASDLVELSTWSAQRPSSQAQALVDKLCPVDPNTDAFCRQRLEAEVAGGIVYYEASAEVGIGTLRSLMAELAKVPLRKTVVLVSGGVVSADMPGGRPDIRDLGTQIGKVAAAAGVNVYTLFIDHSRMTQRSAETRKARNSVLDLARDENLYGRWLDQFSGTAGGSMLRVSAGDGEPAFNRVLAETSAYYLLGVESTADDRDGRPHELKVKIQDRLLSVRGRSWLVAPPPGARPGGGATAATLAPTPVPVRAATPVTPAVRTLADAFDRDDRQTITKLLATPNADETIKAFRGSESPWPESPRRTAAFALDVALIGLRTESRFTKDEALRLLVEYTVRVRQPALNDPFECAWLRVESAGLEGLYSPEISAVLIDRAIERCGSDPRLRLALAVVRDQQLQLSSSVAVSPRQASAGLSNPEQVVLDAFVAAAANPETRDEARIRAAWLCFRAGRPADGLDLLKPVSAAPEDRQVHYLAELVRGHLLRAAGQSDAAVAALRAALVVWPRAQAARLALMTLLVNRGDTEEAATLAEAVQTAALDDGDPWWLYALGDYRSSQSLRSKLREVIR